MSKDNKKYKARPANWYYVVCSECKKRRLIWDLQFDSKKEQFCVACNKFVKID